MMRTLSLKMRMTVSVAILFLVFLSLGTFWGVTYFKRDLQREITHRQNTIALAVANHIDNILKAHQGALLALARQVPPGILGQPGEAEKFLRKHDRGRHSFHGHLLILAPTGKLVAASSSSSEQLGRDFSTASFFRQTLRRQAPAIPGPLANPLKQGA